MLAIELPREEINSLFGLGDEVEISVDLVKGELTATGNKTVTCRFTLNEFDRKLVEAGGWLAYADKKY
jgi:3-isopropylmalate/(R)-2-methylmalate dehydratase small subunit